MGRSASSAEGKSQQGSKNWLDLINESVHTSDDIDIGDISAINRGFVVVKRGFVHVHYYYIPIQRVEGWDGHVLWLKVTEAQVKENYERSHLPDLLRYYVKDYPYYNASFYPPLAVISSRHVQTKYPDIVRPPSGLPDVYKCDLCGSEFDDEEKLIEHISREEH